MPHLTPRRATETCRSRSGGARRVDDLSRSGRDGPDKQQSRSTGRGDRDRSPPMGFNLFVLQIISGKDSSEALRATLQIAADPALAPKAGFYETGRPGPRPHRIERTLLATPAPISSAPQPSRLALCLPVSTGGGLYDERPTSASPSPGEPTPSPGRLRPKGGDLFLRTSPVRSFLDRGASGR